MDFHEVIRKLVRGDQNTDEHKAAMLAAVDEHEQASKPAEPAAEPAGEPAGG